MCNTHFQCCHVSENSVCVNFNTKGLTASTCNNYVVYLWETNVKQMAQNVTSEHFGLTNKASCSVGGDILQAKIYFFILAFHRRLEVKAVFNSLLLLLLQVEHCHTLRRDFGDTHFPLWTAPSTGKKVSRKKHHSLMSGLEPSLPELYLEWVNYSITSCSRHIWSIRLYFLDTQKCLIILLTNQSSCVLGWCQWKWPQCVSAQLLGDFQKH